MISKLISWRRARLSPNYFLFFIPNKYIEPGNIYFKIRTDFKKRHLSSLFSYYLRHIFSIVPLRKVPLDLLTKTYTFNL